MRIKAGPSLDSIWRVRGRSTVVDRSFRRCLLQICLERSHCPCLQAAALPDRGSVNAETRESRPRSERYVEGGASTHIEGTSKEALAPPPKLPADSPDRVDVVRRFIQQYDGGDCFFMTPIAVSSTAAVVEGFGASTAPFELLDKTFKKTQGFEASIGVRLVTPQQCPAITFLNRLRVDGGRSPRISLGSVKLQPGETLVGSIENFANRVVELLLISDNGLVQNMSYLLKPGTDALSFAIDIPRSDEASGARRNLSWRSPPLASSTRSGSPLPRRRINFSCRRSPKLSAPTSR